MGTERRATSKDLRNGRGDERLYIEFRRNGVPVDPAPWFADLREKVSG